MVYRFQSFTGDLKDIVSRDAPVEDRDLTLENHGVFGYTAADFQDTILGDSKQLKKLEVFTTDISGAATLVDTGLGNLKVFTKTQLLTYKGTVTYTVDLGELEIYLCKNPDCGDTLEGTGGVKKFRWALEGRGKSGGARVISYTDVLFETMSGRVVLLSIYDKSEQSTITDKRIKQLLKEAGIK